MENLLLTLSKLQKNLHISLCAELLNTGTEIDQDIIATMFPYIISQQPYPPEYKETLESYIKVLLEDESGKIVLGHALRIKKMMIAKSGDFDQYAKFSKHVELLGIDTFEEIDVIAPNIFTELVNDFEEGNETKLEKCSESPDVIEQINALYDEDSISNVKTSSTGTGSGCLMQMVGYLLIIIVVANIL